MNKLTFAVCLAVLGSIAVPTSDAEASVQRGGTKSGHKSHVRGKSPSPTRRKVYVPANLWTRLRTGIALSRPMPVDLPPPPIPPVLDPFPATAPSGVPGAADALMPTAESIPTTEAELLLRRRAKTPATEPVLETRRTSASDEAPAEDTQRPFTIEEIIEQRRLAYQAKVADYQRQLAEFEGLLRQQAIHERFQENLNWYAERLGFVRQSVQRARPFLHLIVDELDRRRLPLDLALLPILESGYKLKAESPKEASGIWQFIPSTGQLYGLPRTERYDGRLDVARATRAAAGYLAYLGRRFKGDWLLALASYNCGEGRVEQAIAANRTRELPTDFWALELPEETKAYVPRLLALSEIFSRPDAFRLNLQPIPNQPYLAHVRLDRELPVDDVARLADISVDRFLYLNPAFMPGTVGIQEASEILLPAHQVSGFAQRLATFLNPPDPTRDVFAFAGEIEPHSDAALFAEPPSVRPYLSATGDKAGSTDTRGGETGPGAGSDLLGTRPAAPSAGKGPHSAPSGAHEGTIPATTELARSIPETAGSEVVHTHDVAVGETLERIAAFYGMDVATLRSHNKLKPKKRVQPGDRLYIPLAQAAPLDLLPPEADRFAHPVAAESDDRRSHPSVPPVGCKPRC